MTPSKLTLIFALIVGALAAGAAGCSDAAVEPSINEDLRRSRCPSSRADSPAPPPVSPTEVPPTPPAPEGAPAAGSDGTSWVDTLVSDMLLFHDGPCAVLESLRGWGSGASWPEATPRPAGYGYAIPWAHTMEDTSHPNGDGYPWRVPGPYTGNQAPNTRVQQRDMQLWWLLSDGSWVLGSHNAEPGGAMYPLNWAEGTQIDGSAGLRDESANGGGVSMRSIGQGDYSKHLWHTWGSPRPIPANAVGAATAFFSRLVLDNPSGPDDRDKAHILSAGSGDWYKDEATITGAKAQGVNVLYMGFGRLKYVTKDWQLFGWTNLSEAQVRANPPPFVDSSK